MLQDSLEVQMVSSATVCALGARVCSTGIGVAIPEALQAPNSIRENGASPEARTESLLSLEAVEISASVENKQSNL